MHNTFPQLPLAMFAASGAADRLPLQMLIVFGFAKLLAELAQRLRMPGVVGGLTAGILIGPSVLGWVQYDELLHAMAELGVMFLLFQVGLEVRASELVRVGKVALLSAVLGVLLPFAAGWGIMTAAGHPQIESIFMGAAMVATSVGITAQVLASKGVLNHRTAQVILAAAVIDDVLGLLVLAVVSSMARVGGADWAGLATSTAVSVIFIAAVVKFGARTVGLVVPKLTQNLRLDEAEFAVALTFLFLMAMLATYSGVAAIIGAFLAGMVLSETASHHLHTLVRGAGELMVPFFLASIGLQMDLSVFSSSATIVLGLVILAAAVASKWIGCGLGAAALGWKDASRVGAGMVPRGEVGMVVAQVGLKAGAISQPVYGIAVFMAVMTTILAPPVLSLLYRDIAGKEPRPPEVELG
ncbi:MAG: sodium:proton antiporter [Bryobacteraceae bacterium]|nr:MAG: sodium:proton antiporter [Bryobacteraceae bacterium]